MQTGCAAKNRSAVPYAVIAVLLLTTSLLAVYAYNVSAGRASSSSPTGGGSRLNVLVTFYPIYDFTQNVGGDRISVTLLVPHTVDVHSFEPTPSAVRAVAHANLLIYSGAGLEPWISQIVSAAGNPNLVVVDSSQGIPTLPVPPQFQKENQTIDPHIWLDPVLAKQQVQNILQGLVKADPTDASYFISNAQAYEEKLDYLNQEFVRATSNAKTHQFVTFHEAFAYFAAQYNLTQLAILGPFEDTPTPSDIANVIHAIHQYHLCYVGYESLENSAIAQSIGSQTNVTLVPMNPIEGLTAAQQQTGANYLVLMKQTLNTLTLSLNHVGCS